MIQTKFGFHWSCTFRGEDFWKSLRRTTDDDDGRQVMAIAHMTLWVRWANNNIVFNVLHIKLLLSPSPTDDRNYAYTISLLNVFFSLGYYIITLSCGDDDTFVSCNNSITHVVSHKGFFLFFLDKLHQLDRIT
jgi:hypothetical protein